MRELSGLALAETVDAIEAKEKTKEEGRKVAAKYRNPDNREETWAGRGATPRWLRAKIKEGHKLEEFAIGKPGRKPAARKTKR